MELSSMKATLDNVQLTETLLQEHGASDAKESEVTSNMQQITIIEDIVNHQSKTLLTRNTTLHSTKTNVLAKAVQATSDCRSKINQASSSFVVLLNGTKNNSQALTDLKNRGTVLKITLGKNDRTNNKKIIHDVRKLLETLHHHKKCVHTEKTLHSDLKNRLHTITQSLSEIGEKLKQSNNQKNKTLQEFNALTTAANQNQMKFDKHQSTIVQEQEEHASTVQTYETNVLDMDTNEKQVDVKLLDLEEEKNTILEELKNSKSKYIESKKNTENIEKETTILLKSIEKDTETLETLQKEANERAMILQENEKDNAIVVSSIQTDHQIVVSNDENENEDDTSGSPSDSVLSASPSVLSDDGSPRKPSPAQRMDTSALLVVELRRELKSRGHDTNGRKSVLLARLNDVLDEEAKAARKGMISSPDDNDMDSDDMDSDDSPSLTIAAKPTALDLSRIIKGNAAEHCEQRIHLLKAKLNDLGETLVHLGLDTTSKALNDKLKELEESLKTSQQNSSRLNKLQTSKNEIDTNDLIAHHEDNTFVDDVTSLLEKVISADAAASKSVLQLSDLIADKKQNIQIELDKLHSLNKKDAKEIESKVKIEQSERDDIRTELDMIENQLEQERSRLNGRDRDSGRGRDRDRDHVRIG